jgi:hypothetical protein
MVITCSQSANLYIVDIIMLEFERRNFMALQHVQSDHNTKHVIVLTNSAPY